MKRFVVVDIETTGNSPKKGDRIIQFAAVIIENNKIIDTYTTYINPLVPISPFIVELTGIDNELVKDAPLFNEVAEKIREILDGAFFVAHNVHFDLTFIQDELEISHFPKVNCPIIDTVEMSRILMPTLESYKLNDIALNAGFEHENPHRADSDAFVTAEWFLTLLQKIKTLPKETVQDLYQLSKSLKSDLHILFHEALHDQSNIQEQDLLNYRGIRYKKPINFYKNEQVNTNISLASITQLLEKGFQSEFELRDGQEEMVLDVYYSLKNGDISLIEAEIGFGKTISYTLPAAIYSINHQKPVIISANTISQQHHILNIEVPRVEKILNQKVNAQILKGKSHYLNIWKFERLLRQKSEQYDEIITKMQILVWLTETENGDVDELHLTGGSLQFWQNLTTASMETQPAHDVELDFFERALDRSKHANLIITNHHYLLADITYDQPFLPSYEHVIIDEAHHFEKIASKFFGNRLSFRQAKFFISQLGTLEQRKLLKKLEQLSLSHDHVLQMMTFVENFSVEVDDFFQIIVTIRREHEIGRRKREIVLKDNLKLKYAWERFYDAYKKLLNTLEEIYRDTLNQFEQLSDAQKLIVEELSIFLLNFSKIDEFHHHFVTEGNWVIWLEYDGRSPLSSAVLYCEPLSIEDKLARHLYTSKKSIIFTSATITVKNSFQYIRSQLGLNNFPVKEKKFLAPKKLNEGVNLFAIKDVPSIKGVDEQEFAELISSYIISIADVLEGRILVLFTSQEMLRSCYSLIKDSGELLDYIVLAQGISSGGYTRLLKQFYRFEKSLLFGSISFWDGLDLDREEISTIIMVRLPFSSPNEPIHKGKSKLYKQQGMNSFYDFSLPEAVIRFKQGFGRLVRAKSKERNLIIFDNRIYDTKYGKTFLQSIPNIPLQIVSFSNMIEQLEQINQNHN